MRLSELHGLILSPEGWRDGRIAFDAGGIVALEGGLVADSALAVSTAPRILPGFIDLHVHGGGGRDFMEGSDAALHIARCHARHGTTALLATTMTAPPDEIAMALRALARHRKTRRWQDGTEIACAVAGGARLLGVHLEGPYISPDKLGAQPDCATTASLAAIDDFHALAPLLAITLAPEIADHLALIPHLAQRGLRIQLGHSGASYEQGCQALACGAHGFTHLFNAMSGLHHRAPGLVGAALAHARHAELIPDLLHVHPGAIRAALRAIPELYCVTDATAATGMPDGDYRLGRQTVSKCLGGVRLADGTLAGSTLTMDQALRNLVAIGLPLAEASHRLSRIPADYLGLPRLGRLSPGAAADLVVLDPALNVQRVFIEGVALVLADAC